MTDERIKELRLNCGAPWSPSIYVVEECLDEIERQAEHIRRLREALNILERDSGGRHATITRLLAETEPL